MLFLLFCRQPQPAASFRRPHDESPLRRVAHSTAFAARRRRTIVIVFFVVCIVVVVMGVMRRVDFLSIVCVRPARPRPRTTVRDWEMNRPRASANTRSTTTRAMSVPLLPPTTTTIRIDRCIRITRRQADGKHIVRGASSSARGVAQTRGRIFSVVLVMPPALTLTATTPVMLSRLHVRRWELQTGAAGRTATAAASTGGMLHGIESESSRGGRLLMPLPLLPLPLPRDGPVSATEATDTNSIRITTQGGHAHFASREGWDVLAT